jgi:hypothetical protein
MKTLLPTEKDIPDEFWRGHGKWNTLVSQIFFCGGKIKSMKPKGGIDSKDALNHIKAILASFEPKHEHKEAGCAYLFSLWFDEFEIEPAKPDFLKDLEPK